jgi:hypothetical protein
MEELPTTRPTIEEPSNQFLLEEWIMLGVNLANSKLAHSGGLFYIRQLAVFLV